MISAIIVAAGSGTRMKAKENKVLLPLGRTSILGWSLQTIDGLSEIDEIIVVISDHDRQQVERLVQECHLEKRCTLVQGGATRQESVWKGLMGAHSPQKVLIHDGARPFASPEVYQRVIEALAEKDAVIPTIPVKDTIKVCTQGKVDHTLERYRLQSVQTPQGFDYDLLVTCHKNAQKVGLEGTDDASLVEAMGKPVYTVLGDYKNIKMTTQEDLYYGRRCIGEPKMRVGFGYDIHQLEKGRPCILGGISIESDVGPKGHSDADVLIHALMDALLGAAGLEDIGYYFPNTEPSLEGISSLILLEKVRSLLEEKGYRPSNVDLMYIGEVPKIGPHVRPIKEKLSKALALETSAISVKATTNEKLGAIGRCEGVAAQAVVTIIEREDF